MLNILKRLFCRHKYKFKRNAWGNNWSLWECTKCGKMQTREYVVRNNRYKQLRGYRGGW